MQAQQRLIQAAGIAAVGIAAAAWSVQPSDAQSTTAAAAPAANECLARPNGVPPRGSHWFYRLERSNGRRCWFLGPESMRVRRAEAEERRQAARPTPSPVPRPEMTAPRAETVTPREPAPAARIAPARAATVEAPGPDFSPFWPALASTTVALESAQAPADSSDSEPAFQLAAEASLTRPYPETAGVAVQAAAPGIGHLLLFLAASAGFVAIAFRATLKLWSTWIGRRRYRPPLRPAPQAVRPRMPARLAFEELAAREPARPRPPAERDRWDTIDRVLRHPRPPHDIIARDLPRRRAVA